MVHSDLVFQNKNLSLGHHMLLCVDVQIRRGLGLSIGRGFYVSRRRVLSFSSSPLGQNYTFCVFPSIGAFPGIFYVSLLSPVLRGTPYGMPLRGIYVPTPSAQYTQCFWRLLHNHTLATIYQRSPEEPLTTFCYLCYSLRLFLIKEK